MKKFFGFALCLMLVILCACALADVKINETNFPDENFRYYVEDEIDKDKSGSLSTVEIADADMIDVDCSSITSLKGIEFFTALKYLNCETNQLSSLDVSKNIRLERLYCQYNKLTTLNVSGNTVLEILDCSGNYLKSLNVKGNPTLKVLSCNDNQLTSLDVSRNTKLEELDCYNNYLTSLNIRKNTDLESLMCGGNKLKSLDTSQNNALEYLDCSNNLLSSLNVSRNTKLDCLHFTYNDLKSLDISNNTKLTAISCDYNKLTALDVKANTILEVLDCNDNKLTSLDVSTNTKLRMLCCKENKLSALDVSKCPVLCRYMNNRPREKTENTAHFGEEFIFGADMTITGGGIVSKPNGAQLTVSGGVYKLDNAKKTAIFTNPSKIKAKSLTIPNTVHAFGSDYKVTEIKGKACKGMKKLITLTIGANVTKIGSKAFADCGKLKKIIIKCAGMKKSGFGSGCFSNINAKATFRVPKAMLKKYKEWIIKNGKAPKTVKIKKY